MRFRKVILPPQSESSRALARRFADSVPEATVVVAETSDDVKREIATADAAYGTLPAAILRHAERLRWLQSPQAAPPAGYYHPDLIAHPVIVTNLQGIFADRVPAHIMAYVLAFARGLHTYMDRQREHLWDSDHPAPVVHLPGSIALVVGVGSIGAAAAHLCSTFGMRVIGRRSAENGCARRLERAAPAGSTRSTAADRGFHHPHDAPHAEDRRAVRCRALRSDEEVLHQRRSRDDHEARRSQSGRTSPQTAPTSNQPGTRSSSRTRAGLRQASRS